MVSEKIQFSPMIPKREPQKKDIVGLASEFVDNIEKNIQYNQVFQMVGILPDKIYFLNGPPGVGKTYSIKVLNNHLNQQVTNKLEELNKVNLEKGGKLEKKIKIKQEDFKLAVFEYNIGRYGTAYINMGSRIIQSFFDQSLEIARGGTDVFILMDEADALLSPRRTGIYSSKEDGKILETIMKNLQEVHDTEGIYAGIITNLPEGIDSAVLRAGRIDRRIEFKLPNYEERVLGFKNAIKTLNKKSDYKVIRNYNPEILSEISEGFNYADVYQSIEKSVREKVYQLIETKEKGVIKAGYVNQKGLEGAVRKHFQEFKEDKRRLIGFKNEK